MSEKTAIEWTDHTFNPWWGCTNVSPGCDHCYAEAFAKRTGHDVWGKTGARRFFGDKHWAEPLKWNRQADGEGRRHRVFCASMADVFEPRDDLDEHRARLFELIEATPALDWQLLTKRPEQMTVLASPRWSGGWPGNVWAGTTVEDQAYADLRVPRLLRVPAAVRFLSCEPLLGAVDLNHWLIHCRYDWANADAPRVHGECRPGGTQPGVDWVIVGGESGPHHRPFDLDWARSLRDSCTAAGVSFFFKQVGGRTPTAGGHLLDGQEWHQFPLRLAA